MERSTDREVREKLATRGVESLTQEELLSIVMGDGAGVYSAIEVAHRMLSSYDGSLLALSRAGLAKLRMVEGIGMKRASGLAAAFELSSRLKKQEALSPAIIRTKDDVVGLFEPFMGRLQHEEMWVLYMSSANGVLEKNRVSQGGVTSLIVDYKLVIKRAVELLASSMIIVHNHPSGVAIPSEEDIEITHRLTEAAALFDIMIVDHIIIADGTSYSFRQHGFIK